MSYSKKLLLKTIMSPFRGCEIAKFSNFATAELRNFEIAKFRNLEIAKLRNCEISKFRNPDIQDLGYWQLPILAIVESGVR